MKAARAAGVARRRRHESGRARGGRAVPHQRFMEATSAPAWGVLILRAVHGEVAAVMDVHRGQRSAHSLRNADQHRSDRDLRRARNHRMAGCASDDPGVHRRGLFWSATGEALGSRARSRSDPGVRLDRDDLAASAIASGNEGSGPRGTFPEARCPYARTYAPRSPPRLPLAAQKHPLFAVLASSRFWPWGRARTRPSSVSSTQFCCRRFPMSPRPAWYAGSGSRVPSSQIWASQPLTTSRSPAGSDLFSKTVPYLRDMVTMTGRASPIKFFALRTSGRAVSTARRSMRVWADVAAKRMMPPTLPTWLCSAAACGSAAPL